MRQKTKQSPKCALCKSTLPEKFEGLKNCQNIPEDSGSPDRSQYHSQHSMTRANLIKSEEMVTNTTRVSKYI